MCAVSTNTSGIDTEPALQCRRWFDLFHVRSWWRPADLSNAVAGGAAPRVTFNGDYNISARVSPDGKQLAYIGRRGGRLQVHVLDLATGQEVPVTDTTSDESPSFAPNGRLLLYATEVNGRGILASASTDGRVRTRLSGPSGDIREPTVGPLLSSECITKRSKPDITLLLRSTLLAAAFVSTWRVARRQSRREAAAPIVDANAGTAAQTARPAPSLQWTPKRSGLDPLNDPNNPLSKRSVFFELRQLRLQDRISPGRSDARRFLGTNKQRRVTVEGHTDERGGRSTTWRWDRNALKPSSSA